MRRVIVAFPQADGQTGVAIKNAFTDLKWNVEPLDPKENPEKLSTLSRVFRPKLIFCSRTRALAPEIDAVQSETPDVKTCVWNVDIRKTLQEWGPWLPLFRAVDYLFTVSESKAQRLKENVNPNTHYLSQGLQRRVYHPVSNKDLTLEDHRKYDCDVCFAGGVEGGEHVHGWREEYHRVLNNMDIDVNYWGCYGNPKIMNQEHNKAVACSKINLGMSMLLPQSTKYTSVRDYKILGAGGFLLTKYSGQMEDMMPVGEGMDVYHDKEEMKEKIEYYLSHPKKREEMATRGRKWAENNTYLDRIKQALKTMEIPFD